MSEIATYRKKRDSEIEQLDRPELVQYIRELESKAGLYPADAFTGENHE